MALPVLMSDDELNHALEVFKRASLHSKALSRRRFLHLDPHVSTDVEVYIPIAVHSVNAPPLPSENGLVYQLPKLHVHALATFTAAAMRVADFAPTLVTDPKQASQVVRHFQDFLQVLVNNFPQYIFLSGAGTTEVSGSCDTVWKDIKDYLQHTEDADAIDEIVELLQKAMLQVPTFAEEDKVRALYTIFSFRASEINPEVHIYWAEATMTKKEGSKISTWEATVTITRFTAQLISNSVTADAHVLAGAKAVSVQSLVEAINFIE